MTNPKLNVRYIRTVKFPKAHAQIMMSRKGSDKPTAETLDYLALQLKSHGVSGGSSGGSGDVTGPGSATDGDFAQFNGTTGKIIKDGGLSLDTDGTLAADSDTRIPSQKAVKTYVDSNAGDIQADLDGIGNAQGDILFRGASDWEVLAPGTSGQVLVTGGAGADPSWANGSTVTTSVDADMDLTFFGTGVDGDLSISSGTTNLSRDMFYNNVTISGTAKINLNGWRLYAAGTLDISSAPAGAITNTNTATSINGNNSGNTAGATGGTTSSINTVGRGQTGGAGPSGGLTNGTQATAVGSSGNALPNAAGAGGKGGNVGANTGGASRSGATGTQTLTFRRITHDLFGFINTTFTICLNGPGAPGGSSGAGDSVGAGGGGAGGGATPGIVWIAARTIARDSSTSNARAINADGGNGGNGGKGTSGTNTGGGGGGGGAPGGWLYIIYRFKSGTSKTDLLSATGGNGGNGGDGRGTGIGGDGGASGSKGRIDLFCLADGSWTHAETDTTTVAGSAGSGPTGGAGGTANAQTLTF